MPAQGNGESGKYRFNTAFLTVSDYPFHLMQEYLKKCKISGEIIIPFATAGANGKDSSLETVKELFKGCEIKEYFYTSPRSKSDPDEWLARLKSIVK